MPLETKRIGTIANNIENLPVKRIKSMEYGTPRHIDVNDMKYQVMQIIKNTGSFDEDSINEEIEWFFGPLGLHDFYFIGNSVEVMAEHIQSLFAAKLLAKCSHKEMVLKLEQQTENGAFFATKSHVQEGDCGKNYRINPMKESDAELERQIERDYLNAGSECIGDGVRSGYDFLAQKDECIAREYRVQCYRSSGVLAEEFPHHIRMYFLQKPEFVNPKPAPGTLDINQLADKRFLERAGDNLKSIYARVIAEACQQMTPAFDTEVWVGEDGNKMARLVIAYRSGATHSYFSSIADVYRSHCLFSTRKYVEFFSNGIVVFGFYLQVLEPAARGSGTIEQRIQDCVTDASLHFVLPRTSLSPMLTKNLLTPQEISYAYAAWKFAFHFLHRLPDAFIVLSESLRLNDPQSYSRLENLRKLMKFNTFTESQILDAILVSAPMIKILYNDFLSFHSPNEKTIKQVPKDVMLSTVSKHVQSEMFLMIFSSFVNFNRHILWTNFFRAKKSALAFRLDGLFLSKAEYPEKPYAIIYVIGSEFRGFHVRFADIARGGIRMIRSSHAGVYARNVSSLFDECYSLASTQQRKNKDIPEGGSKGVILLNLAHQDKATIAFKKYIDALLDIMLPDPSSCCLLRKEKEELLFLGPDEGTADLMDWASSHARTREYKFWKAITTGKSASRGGIPHDVYGMTTHSVRQYVTGIKQKLNLKSHVTKVQTGGPDGDLGSNEIKMSEEVTIAIVDGSGVLYDPKGIDRNEIVRLANKREPISGFSKKKLSQEGYAVYVAETDVKLPNGQLIENGTHFRNTFHFRPDVFADFFVPCGGRPAAVNLDNVKDFLYQNDQSTLRFKYIVEGANLFFTQDARLQLEEAGVLLFKDSSANKGGVTSSSLEVLAALCMTDEEFAQHMQVDEKTGTIPDFYKKYVVEVQHTIDMNAQNEFECMWKEHKRTKTPFSILSDQLSERITELTLKIASSSLWLDTNLRHQILDQAFPQVLRNLLGRQKILDRLPTAYTQSVFASQVASKFIYKAGLAAPEFAFYEFVQSFLHSTSS